MSILLQNAHLADSGKRADVLIEGDRIQKLGQSLAAPAGCEVIDLKGKVLSPGFVDIHTHMDKAYTGDLFHNASGTLQEAMDTFYNAVNSFTEEQFYERGRRMLDEALLNGTLYLRSHIVISTRVELRAIRALAKLKRDYAHLMRVEIVAFPGDEPGGMSDETIALTLRAFEEGADIVGGTPNRYDDEIQNIELMFRIAKEVGRDLDLHIDEKDEPRADSLRRYVELTAREGYGGRVTAGHCCSLSALEEAEADELIRAVKEVDMNVVTLPSCNLYLIGRGDKGLVRRGATRINELLAAGVNLSLSSDNIRDPFRPFGNADMLEEALLTAQIARMDTPERLMQAYRMATCNPARAMHIENYGLAEGNLANLVVLDATSVPEAILNGSDKLYVVSGGKIIVRRSSQVVRSF